MGLLDGMNAQTNPVPQNAGIGAQLSAMGGSAAQALRAVGSRQALQQAAINRLSAIGSPEAQRMAQLISQDPHSAQAMASAYGGFAKMEAGLKAKAIRDKATAALSQPGTPREAFQAATGAGIDPYKASHIGANLAQIDAREAVARASRAKAAGAGGLTAAQTLEASRIAAARGLLEQYIGQNQWQPGPKVLRHIMAGKDLLGLTGVSPQDKFAARLWSSAMKTMPGEGSGDYAKYIFSLIGPQEPPPPPPPPPPEEPGVMSTIGSKIAGAVGAVADAFGGGASSSTPKPIPRDASGQADKSNMVVGDVYEAYHEGHPVLVRYMGSEKLKVVTSPDGGG